MPLIYHPTMKLTSNMYSDQLKWTVSQLNIQISQGSAATDLKCILFHLFLQFICKCTSERFIKIYLRLPKLQQKSGTFFKDHGVCMQFN